MARQTRSTARAQTIEAPPPLGRRERNKIEKLARIKAAARKLFVKVGYDNATTARIADEADVSMSTIFFYAEDKRDLLFLIFNDWFNGALDEMEAAFDPRRPVVESVLALFRPLYEHHTAEPNIARATLRELNFFSSGKQSQRFFNNTARILTLIARIAEAGQQRGEIDSSLDNRLCAEMIFGLYQAEIRRYLANGAKDVEAGLKRLRAVFDILMRGFAPYTR